MHKALSVALVTLLLGCGNNGGDQLKKESRPLSSNEALLSKYKQISFDTLHVFATDSVEDKRYRFAGRKLDSAAVLLLPATDLVNPGFEFFGSDKFYIDSRHIGLITRTPAEYVSSSIKLYIFDTETNTVKNYVELAEYWGDAGDVAIKKAWLFKEKDKQFHSFIWMHESHDNSVEDPQNKTIETRDNYYLLRISGNKIDTISRDNTALAKRFAKLLPK